MNKSEAKRIREIIQKHKGFIRDRQTLANFKEPIALLMRRNNHIEFFESITKGRFEIKHSDGDARYIEITPSKQQSIDYAGRTVRGYILHEDFPTPLPEEPVATTEIIAISQEKAMHDINKYNLKEQMIKSGAWLKILLGVGGVILAVGLAIMIVPSTFWDSIFKEEIIQTAINATQNVTIPLLG